MKKYALHTMLCLLALAPAGASAQTPTAPIHNPFLADSAYPVAHGYGDLTPFAGPKASSRQLQVDEIAWKKVGPINGYAPIFSNPYPNGKRVIWVGGYDRVAKLDAESLEVLTTYGLGGNTYFGEEEIDRHIARMDAMNDEQVAVYEQNLWRIPYRSVQSAYRMISRDNELYMPYRSSEGIALRVFADSDPADPASDIVLKREWKVPPELSRANIMSVNMTYDGWVVMVTQDGVMVALARDFSQHKTLKLPRKGEEPAEANFFAAFVRNGLTVDNQNGIYVVTRDNLHRVQWTGSKLSLDEADGAWSAAYPNEVSIGSGTTPTPMGWGPKEDHLVIIADGTKGNRAMALWRDKIPSNWKGLPGYDRRVAGVTPIVFGVSPNESIQVENAAVVYGYGAFFNNFDNSFLTQFMPKAKKAAEREDTSGVVHLPGKVSAGGSRIDWDPKNRTLKTVWKNQTNFVNTVCTVSSGSNMVYCWGMRDRQWTLEGVDWKSGASAVHYTLGPSKRYDALGGPIIVDHNGDVNCACSGGLGMVRVRVKNAKE
ncbi:MAG: hypothetical protein ABW034_24740 [Steroidobacteraceae bacterium]